MKKTIITSVTALVLGVSLSHAGGCGGSKGSSCSIKKSYTKSKTYSKPKTYTKTYTKSTYQKPVKYVSHEHHYDRGGDFQIALNHGLGDPKAAFLARLSHAPRGYGYGHFTSFGEMNSIAQAATMAHNVRMLGKVSYDWGKSTLSTRAKLDIETLILRERPHLGPNALIVVFGYADKTGAADVNLRISNDRARHVQAQIDRLNWSFHLNLETASIAMGENIELCSHSLGHNRVAEIWLVEFPKPVKQITTLLPAAPAPAVAVQTLAAPVNVAMAPATAQITAPAPAVASVQAPQALQMPAAPVQQLQAPQMTAPAQPQIQAPQMTAPAQPQLQAPQMTAPAQPQLQAPQMTAPVQPQLQAPQMPAAPVQPQLQTPQAPAAPTPAPAQPEALEVPAAPTQFQAPVMPVPQTQTTAIKVPAAPAPVATPAQSSNAIESLIQYLEKNVVLQQGADPAELASQLAALRQLQSAK